MGYQIGAYALGYVDDVRDPLDALRGATGAMGFGVEPNVPTTWTPPFACGFVDRRRAEIHTQTVVRQGRRGGPCPAFAASEAFV